MGKGYFVKTPSWLKKIYPSFVWDMEPKEKKLYLTFDDGPHPVITPFTLNLLKQFNAKATFFCIGENVQKYPDVYHKIIEEGHSTGNHTQHHLNGWATDDEDYLLDVAAADVNIRSGLFRPPYGRIKRSQFRLLKKKHPGMKVIMWSILAGDWDESLKPERCFDRIIKNTSGGDIIVLHETEKAYARLAFVLPKTLNYFSEKGYKFKEISL